MIAWWNGMDLAGRIFALIAIPSTLVLVVQTILLFFGIGDDIDGDLDIPSDDGFVLFSLRGIMGMAAVGGWSGLVLYQTGLPLGLAVLLALIFGFLALVGIAWLMKISLKLQSSGNLDLGYAIGKVGTVYIPIPADMKGTGKVNITLQERLMEVNAVTAADRKLATGESVRVVATDETGILVVEPFDK
ncbi:MAG: NfeD family protein [Clostridia bacterium]|nr:NfeD family protein [Clostridia bacterium]